MTNSENQLRPSTAPKLEITQGDDLGAQYKVEAVTRIGRELDNDIVLIDTKISRYHAEIVMEQGQCTLLDLGSSNKTYLNGAPLTDPMPLQDGDKISLGETELTFFVPQHSAHPHDTIPLTAVVPPRTVEATPRGSSRFLWLAGLLVFLLVLVTGMVLYNLVANRKEMAQQNSTPTSPFATSVISDTESLKLVIAYQDDFSDSQSGWDDTSSDKYTRKVYGNNRYQVEVSTSNLVARGLANRDVADFVIEVEAKLEDGDPTNTSGLLFRFKDDKNFYRFDLANDGYYKLSKFVEGQWTDLVAEWTKAESFKPNEANLLKVSAFGSKITTFVNGQKAAEVTDSSFTHGNFGFFASTFDKPYNWVSFDNLTLQVPENTEKAIVLIPTATRPFAPLEIAPTDTSTPIPTSADTATVAPEAQTMALPTATLTPTFTPEPKPTPVPLPEYASRNQPLARGAERPVGRIIFPRFEVKQGTYHIYSANALDGSDLQLIQKNSSQPACSADGQDFAYRSWQGDKRGLIARPLSGGDEWRFTSFMEDSRPQFSPNKSIMYYSRVGGKDPAIYQVINGKGEVVRNNSIPVQGKLAKWLPSGKQFIYSGCLAGKCGLMISDSAGNNPALLTDDASDGSAEVSPNGATVVFMSRRQGSWGIYRMDINGQNLTALTDDDANEGLPTWSPDGKFIAFVSDQDTEWSIWSIMVDGSNKRRLFPLGGPIDGTIQLDPANSKGWIEENIDWIP